MAQAQRTAPTALATVRLTLTKETKNTVRYDGPAPVSQLYVGKEAFPGGEYPDTITVTIAAA